MLEYVNSGGIFLTHLTQSQAVMNALASADLRGTGGMFPIRWNITSGKPFNCKLTDIYPEDVVFILL